MTEKHPVELAEEALRLLNTIEVFDYEQQSYLLLPDTVDAIQKADDALSVVINKFRRHPHFGMFTDAANGRVHAVIRDALEKHPGNAEATYLLAEKGLDELSRNDESCGEAMDTAVREAVWAAIQNGGDLPSLDHGAAIIASIEKDGDTNP